KASHSKRRARRRVSYVRSLERGADRRAGGTAFGSRSGDDRSTEAHDPRNHPLGDAQAAGLHRRQRSSRILALLGAGSRLRGSQRLLAPLEESSKRGAAFAKDREETDGGGRLNGNR